MATSFAKGNICADIFADGCISKDPEAYKQHRNVHCDLMIDGFDEPFG